jgi:hypothetical protein
LDDKRNQDTGRAKGSSDREPDFSWAEEETARFVTGTGSDTRDNHRRSPPTLGVIDSRSKYYSSPFSRHSHTLGLSHGRGVAVHGVSSNPLALHFSGFAWSLLSFFCPQSYISLSRCLPSSLTLLETTSRSLSRRSCPQRRQRIRRYRRRPSRQNRLKLTPRSLQPLFQRLFLRPHLPIRTVKCRGHFVRQKRNIRHS